MKKFPPYPLLFEPPRLLIFKKISSLPDFSPTQMFFFSTLPAVIRAYPLIEFGQQFQSTLLLEPPHCIDLIVA